jgi:hypothetical protein
MKKLIMVLTTLALSLLGAGSATATNLYPWNNHAAPFNFLFGNDIDGHQQTRLAEGNLFGFFYIKFTGATTSDGYRVATHVNCNTTSGCTVGWLLEGKPGQGIFLYEAQNDHEVFLVSRGDIPEPGAYAHFHWLGSLPSAGQSSNGYFLQLLAVDKFCFFHMLPASINPGVTCEDNGGVAVNLGIDIATHVNIVTSFPSGIVPGI